MKLVDINKKKDNMPFNIQKANEIHNSQYDYSRVTYVDVYTKIEITCPTHGSFWQSPRVHIYSKGGCKQCANDRIRGSFDLNKANEIHNNKYDYSKVTYVNVDTKVEIICPTHGSFVQTPYHHINRKLGCESCKGTKISNSKHQDVSIFVERAKRVHNDRYDYTQVVYHNSHTKVTIVCAQHGAFKQTPTNHLDNKNGCPQCGYNVSASGARWLNNIAPPSILKEHTLQINGQRFKVDGYDPVSNTIYEYFGVFWHGCPHYTDHTQVNPRNGIPYRELYEKTLKRINTFESAGFIVISEWGK